jgi:hypothetical protein
MKTTIRMIILVVLIASPSSSFAASRGRAVVVRSGFVVRPGFAHTVVFSRPFFPFPYVYFYPRPYAYSPYFYGAYTPPYMNYSVQSYSISPPPPPADTYDRGYSEGYAQGYEQAQKDRDKDRYDEGKQRGYQEGYEAGKSGQNP